jgi:hypothetical protein
MEEATKDPLAELASGAGAYIVSYPDGSEWSGPIDIAAGEEPVTWSAVDDQVCVTFPDAMEDAEGFCMVMGELAEDGSWTAIPENAEEGAEPATMRRLDMPATSRADQMSAGIYWAELPEGNRALVYWGADGTSYLAMNPTRSTWRADGSQRCSTPEGGEETCGAPTSEMGEDGTFTAEDGGETITVRML